MFNRFNKNKEKYSSLLSGTWEIELPISEFLNSPSPNNGNTNKSEDSKHEPIN